MRLNPPSAWTQGKIKSLLLLSLLSIREVKSGQQYLNCLKDSYDFTSYKLLLNYPWNNVSDISNKQIGYFCCDTNQCTLSNNVSSAGKLCLRDGSIDIVVCNTIANPMIVCDNTAFTGASCIGIIGDNPIVNKNTWGDCTNYNIDNLINYVMTTSDIVYHNYQNTSSGKYAGLSCASNSPCKGAMCGWDNGGWSCLGGTCLIQWVAPYPTLSSSSEFNNPNIIPIVVPIGVGFGIISLTGLTYYCLIHKQKKQEIKKKLAGKITELEEQINSLRIENDEVQAQALENDKSELESVLSDYENYGKVNKERVPIIKKYFNFQQNSGHIFIDSTIGDNADLSYHNNFVSSQTREEDYEMENLYQANIKLVEPAYHR